MILIANGNGNYNKIKELKNIIKNQKIKIDILKEENDK
jgi:inosine/xanthosine triphosphate pyrophosphatase family protein